jgi:hypothetical protein
MTKKNDTSTIDKFMQYEHLSATSLSKKQKQELLEKSQMFEALTFKQICALILWEWFKPNKLNKFYEALQIVRQHDLRSMMRSIVANGQRYG